MSPTCPNIIWIHALLLNNQTNCNGHDTFMGPQRGGPMPDRLAVASMIETAIVALNEPGQLGDVRCHISAGASNFFPLVFRSRFPQIFLQDYSNFPNSGSSRFPFTLHPTITCPPTMSDLPMSYRVLGTLLEESLPFK